MKDTVILEIIQGVEGKCIALNDLRVCGPKPWGGGTVERSWEVRIEDIERALDGTFTPRRKQKESDS